MSEVYLYRLFCIEENEYVYTWNTKEPSLCPNAHTDRSINTDITTIVKTIATNTVKTEENTHGDFETQHIKMDIPSGNPGNITEHDVTWDMDVLLWLSYLKPTPDMIGDVINVVAVPETQIGAIVSPVIIGDTVLNVDSGIFTHIQRGYLITLDDEINKDVLGRCVDKDLDNNTITVKSPASFSYNPGTPVKISIYIINNLYITDTDVIPIGHKGMKGKLIEKGKIIRVYYTNNSGTSKTFRWRPEYYNNG